MPERPAQFKVHPDPSRPRTSLVVIVLIIWMLIIGGQLVRLQVGQYESLSARARRQQQQTVETTAPRGLILDRSGRELARSLEVDSFFVVPSELTDVHDAATRLAPVLDLKAPELEARLRAAQDAKHKFMWLARQLDADKAKQLEALQLAGVHVQPETKRFYPNGALAAHVLGFVGTDDEGLAGIERIRDTALKGAGGAVRLDGDGLRRAYNSHEQAAQVGRSIVLTIDQNVQYQAEQALSAAMERTHAKSATAIVLDPHTGEILALANAPTFDPNDAHKVGTQTSDSTRAPQDVKR